MKIRNFNHDLDLEAIRRIWREVRWVDDADDEKVIDCFLVESRALVAELNGEAECLSVSAPGDIRHLNSDIPIAIVTAVTTSLVARRQGLASKLTARLIAEDAEAGFAASALGMFDEGYYNRLGFGNGPYEHTLEFDPRDLVVDQPNRAPVRLGMGDYKDIYQAMKNRWRGHGAVRVFSEHHVHAELAWTEKPFGLGFRDNKGHLTHFIWGSGKKERGPFEIVALAYQTREQLLELLSLLGTIGDQVVSIRIKEPFHVQLQDLLHRPHRRMRATRGSELATRNEANTYWQLRINDVEKCLADTVLPGREDFVFNLTLTDPITKYLDSEQNWQGAGGEFTISLGQQCKAQKGHGAGLPLLEAGVPGFSRLWLGCARATSLAVAGEITGSQDLLQQLERTLSLPSPNLGWEI